MVLGRCFTAILAPDGNLAIPQLDVRARGQTYKGMAPHLHTLLHTLEQEGGPQGPEFDEHRHRGFQIRRNNGSYGSVPAAVVPVQVFGSTGRYHDCLHSRRAGLVVNEKTRQHCGGGFGDGWSGTNWVSHHFLPCTQTRPPRRSASATGTIANSSDDCGCTVSKFKSPNSGSGSIPGNDVKS